jgi:hypothetical protein
MKIAKLFCLMAGSLVAVSASLPLRAAEDIPAPGKSIPPQLCENWRNLSPEEKAEQFRAWREKQGAPALSREEREKLREELRDLPPAERRAKMKELREKLGLPGPDREQWEQLSPEERKARLKEWRQKLGAGRFTPEERAAKRKLLRDRLEQRLTELRREQAEGTLSDKEKSRLQRLEELAKRFDQAQSHGVRRLPPGRPGDPPPKPRQGRE